MSEWFEGLKDAEQSVQSHGFEITYRSKTQVLGEAAREPDYDEGYRDYLEYHRVRLLGEVHENSGRVLGKG